MVSILPLQVKLMLALREHRMHHLIWHSVRDNWERIDDESLRWNKSHGLEASQTFS
jgi:hypothetical protein